MLNEHIARGVGPTRIDIAYEQRGNPAHPTVLLVMGIAAQLVYWPLGFLEALVHVGCTSCASTTETRGAPRTCERRLLPTCLPRSGETSRRFRTPCRTWPPTR